MYNLLTLNKIAACGLNNFDKTKYAISGECENPDCIILRSFSMHEMELPQSLKAVARAGAGVNNIPIDKCTEKGIVVFNTPGANANAVKELTIAGLLLSSRKIVDGINWAQTLKDEGEAVGKLVEKGKSNFAGCEIKGKTLAVIGLDALADADYITLHLPLLPDTKGMMNADMFKTAVKKGAKLLNFSRGGLVDNAALKSALEVGLVSVYVTDFPDAEVLAMENVIAIPHLGASSAESEDNCAVMAAQQLIDYMENGNIVNSVNFPAVELARSTGERITIMHKNIPEMLSRFTSAIAAKGVNIENMVDKSKGDNAYAIMDVSGSADALAEELAKLDGVISVRVIK